jgi:protocatechuate 3,4-dioxygenase beta subunit
MHATDDGTFLRGLQFTDEHGVVEFETIYPGWYVGRDTHIHLKVHEAGSIKDSKYAGGHVVHTGQLFFPDELSDEVAKLQPYVERQHIDRVRLDEDMVYADAHGAGVMLKFDQVKSGSLEAGLIATGFLHVDPTGTSAAGSLQNRDR